MVSTVEDEDDLRAYEMSSYDSKSDDKTAILTPHTAFQDPTTPQDAPLRESIELRLLVFYD